MIKRLFALLLSLFGLLLLSPLLLIVALIIISTSRGPVFFQQNRVGQYGRFFRIYKFRTMEVDAEKKGQLTVGKDERITGIGHLLRKTNIDELPQLINVLKGEMSLVGPRPEVPRFVALYTDEQRKVLNIKPGMTDYASLKYRNENELLGNSKNPEEYYITDVMPKKLALNLEYINTKSMILDVKLIIYTIIDIIKSIYSSLFRKVTFKRINLIRPIFYLTFDILFIAISMYGAFYLRFEGIIPDNFARGMGIFILISLAIKIPVLYHGGLYKISWSYVGLNELLYLAKSLFLSSVFLGTILFIFRTYPLFASFPRSILILDFLLTFTFIGNFRISKRIFQQTTGRRYPNGEKVLIIGAGNTGEQIVRYMLSSKVYFPIGFLDDSPKKIGSTIHGVRVIGKRDELKKIAKEYDVESILIAMPSAPPKVIRETFDLGKTAGIKKIKIVPSLKEIISGKVTLADVKEVELEDLLGRDQVKIDIDAIRSYLDGKNVLVTGASGSIGSELCKQILKFNPNLLLALDQDETGLFWLKRKLNDNKIVPIVGNIRDSGKIDAIFSKFKPHVVFHAAAYKHVPVMEEHPDEAVINNVFGTLAIGKVAIRHGTEKFILVSTDKAVNPTSVMGASKRLAEKVIVDLNNQNSTKFAAVRFGNVLGSRGSVIPIFKEQILKGGPVEVTHPDINRYFMVTSEAVLLILQAGAMGKGGEVFVLDMGEPIKIVDLAREMIRLSGFEPDKDISIIFTGLRKGEKLYEELLDAEEGTDSTLHKKINKARLNPENRNLSEELAALKQLSEEGKSEEIISQMRKMIPNYNPAR